VEGKDTYKYFEWGQPDWWIEWTSRFKHDSRLKGVLASAEVESFSPAAPFGYLMTNRYWNERAPMLEAKYPQGKVQRVTHDGKFLAFVVPST
jgi:hypothetical protein